MATQDSPDSHSRITLKGRSVMTEYKWHEFYKAALLESDWSKMEERIRAVEDALHQRKREFDLNHGGTPEENHAVEDAFRGLSVLRSDAATWQRKRTG